MTQCLICLVGLPWYIRFSPRLVVERFHIGIGEVAGSSPGGASFSLKHLCKDLVLSFVVIGSPRVITLS